MGNLRTEQQTHVVEVFKGVNEVIDELKVSDEYTPWSHGGYFNEKAEFERIKGKQLHSSVTTGGHILCLQQLHYANKNVVLVHTSSNWLVEDDLSALGQDPGVIPLVPTEPFIF